MASKIQGFCQSRDYYEPAPSIAEANKAEVDKMISENNFSELFASLSIDQPLIEEVTDGRQIEGKYYFIEMDSPPKIVDASECSLATSAVATCFGICVRGIDKDGKSFIGLEHDSHVKPLESTLTNLKEEMIKNGCLENSVEFYIFGGKIITDDPYHASVSSMPFFKDALGIAREGKFKIKGLRFNFDRDCYSAYSILSTKDKIYFSKNDFFDDKDKLSDSEESDIESSESDIEPSESDAELPPTELPESKSFAPALPATESSALSETESSPLPLPEAQLPEAESPESAPKRRRIN